MELKKCKCGGEAEVYAHYSGVYECIHGFAQCQQCQMKVWGRARVDTYDISTNTPDFPEWKRMAYEKVEQSIVERWNEVMS